MAKHEEHDEQVALFRWWNIQHPGIKHLMFAIPNGGKRGKVTAFMLKNEGVRAGVPDIFLAFPVGRFHGLWIEMKSQKGRTSENQDFMLAELRGQGYDCAVCHGWDEAREKIQSYLGANKA